MLQLELDHEAFFLPGVAQRVGHRSLDPPEIAGFEAVAASSAVRPGARGVDRVFLVSGFPAELRDWLIGGAMTSNRTRRSLLNVITL